MAVPRLRLICLVVGTTYTAIYEQVASGGWRAILGEETRVSTNGRTLAQARAQLRAAAALWLHLDPAAFELIDQVRLPENIQVALDTAARDRTESHAAQQTAMASSREAARLLVNVAMLSRRDAAEILGLSHQRVQQLLSN
jgi:predicted RNase H-like HicB family nuclease